MRNRSRIIKKQLKYDVKNGIINQYKKFIIFTGIIVLFCLMYDQTVVNSSFIQSGTVPGFLDYITLFFRGKEELYHLSQIDIFNIPIEWLVIHSYLLFVIGTYPKRDYEEHGYQFLLRAEKKSYWWLSKCIWIVVTVIFYWFLIIGTTFLFVVLKGGNIFEINKEICFYVANVDLGTINPTQFILVVTLMPILVFIFLCTLELILTFLFNNIVAIIILIGYLSVSVYWCKTWLFANYTMLLRINRVPLKLGIVLLSVSYFGFMIVGYLFFQQMDVLGRQKEKIS